MECGFVADNQPSFGNNGAGSDEKQQPMDPLRLSFIIDMLERIAKIKHLVTKEGVEALSKRELKFFIRTNKGTRGQDKQHITQWGISCLTPSYIFKQVVANPDEKPLSVILTSGTLQPMKILEQELKTNFKIKFVNEHFIKESQVFATVISTDLLGQEFKFNYEC